jgi:acetylornithine deacetylase
MTVELVPLLRQLVSFDSSSTRTNRPIIDFLEPLVVGLGFGVHRQVYRDEAGVEKYNLLAYSPGGSPRSRAGLALVGHTDCVPFAADWKEALSLSESNGRLYGRGACDTKGFIACALTAASRVDRSALKRPLLLAFTADEEVGCFGAKHLLKEGLGQAELAIVGEPTALVPVRAHKGYCLAEVRIGGKEGHSAYPDSGASAIFRAARFLSRLEAESKRLRVEVSAGFEPPFTSVNVGLISGGTARNVIPGECRFTVEWRPIPSQPSEKVLSLLSDIAASLKKEDASFEAEINFQREDAGLNTKIESPVVQFLATESKNAPVSISFGTEAPYLSQLGAEAVVFGPGDIRVAHQTGEFVPVDELLRCEEILRKAMLRFC